MTALAKDLDLSVLSPEYWAVVEAQAARVAQLEEINKRREHLIAEMHHALCNKTSEKLADDDCHLAFEDLEVALADAEDRKSQQAADDDKPKRKKIAKRNRGNLPEGLARIDRVIEPDRYRAPEIRLPHLHRWDHTRPDAALADRGWTAHRRGNRACSGQ